MIVVVGDALLDRDVLGEVSRLTPDAPAPVLEEHEVRTRAGGAALAALLLARDDSDVTLVTALGADTAADELAAVLDRAGVDVVDLGLAATTPEKIRLRAGGTSLARWDRGRVTVAADVGTWTDAADAAVASADAVLVSCYGRGVASRDDARDAIAAAAASAPVVWDPHPRGAAPVPGISVATPNDSEARTFAPDVPGDGLDAVTARAERLVAAWRVGGVAVTRGADGALFTRGGGLPAICPAPAVAYGDPCGAGDRFAATVTAQLAAGELAGDAVATAVVAASRFVAAGGAGTVDAVPPARHADGSDGSGEEDAVALVERVRAQGGTVVATGGCFDLVHAGHIHMLEAARALGDCLVVCVNSDDSVRRLKGADRPIVPAEDRADLLAALACVDAVVIFDEDTPVAALRRLRPHVFAKGGDYGSTTIPEAAVLASWGGQAVALPYLDGRSTTRLLQEVRTRGNHD